MSFYSSSDSPFSDSIYAHGDNGSIKYYDSLKTSLKNVKDKQLLSFGEAMSSIVGDVDERLGNLENNSQQFKSMMKSNTTFLESKINILSQEIQDMKRRSPRQALRVSNSGGGNALSRSENNSFDEIAENDCITRCKHYKAKVFTPDSKGPNNFSHRDSFLARIVISYMAEDEWCLILKDDNNLREEKFRLVDSNVITRIATFSGKKMIVVEDETRTFYIRVKQISTEAFFEKIENIIRSLV
uniref:t-SNARE coiled-coil homology domain-containing protein n=1 Tax=Strongyloides papillosus TaxID=174720 RepID=A0A0N5BD29_STREA